MEEVLYNIQDFSGYKITKTGKVWSESRKGRCRGFFLKPSFDNRGYLQVTLYKNSCGHTRKIHKLVLEIFIGACPKKKEACHKNDNRTDNRVGNLYWGTRSENRQDAFRNGKCSNKKEANPHAKLNNLQVRVIRRLLELKALTQTEIGKVFNVRNYVISNIKQKRTWKQTQL